VLNSNARPAIRLDQGVVTHTTLGGNFCGAAPC
jgi:hypothetical protein